MSNWQNKEKMALSPQNISQETNSHIILMVANYFSTFVGINACADKRY